MEYNIEEIEELDDDDKEGDIDNYDEINSANYEDDINSQNYDDDDVDNDDKHDNNIM